MESGEKGKGRGEGMGREKGERGEGGERHPMHPHKAYRFLFKRGKIAEIWQPLNKLFLKS